MDGYDTDSSDDELLLPNGYVDLQPEDVVLLEHFLDEFDEPEPEPVEEAPQDEEDLSDEEVQLPPDSPDDRYECIVCFGKSKELSKFQRLMQCQKLVSRKCYNKLHARNLKCPQCRRACVV